MDAACASCIARGGICLDENADDQMDRCFCQMENDLCHGRTTPPAMPITQPLRKKWTSTSTRKAITGEILFSVPVVTPVLPNRVIKQGELQLGLYDINQQRLIDNGGSVFIGDRLFIEIKYRTGLFSCPRLSLSPSFPCSCLIFSWSQYQSTSDHHRELLDLFECLRQRCEIREDLLANQPMSVDRFSPFHTFSTDRSRSREKFRLSNQQIRNDISRLSSVFHRHLLRTHRKLSRGKQDFTKIGVVNEFLLAPLSRDPPSTRFSSCSADSGEFFDYLDRRCWSVRLCRRRGCKCHCPSTTKERWPQWRTANKEEISSPTLRSDLVDGSTVINQLARAGVWS